MNAIDSPMIQAVQAVAWALVHFLWQGALAGLAAAGVLILLKNGKASVRYAVAAGFLLLMLALPVATVLRLAGSPAAGPAFNGASLVGPASPSSPGGSPVAAGRLGEEGRPIDALPPVLPWVFGLWVAGVAALSVYHLGGWRVARRLSRQGRAAGEELEAQVRGLCRRLGIERAVILLESAAVAVPSVVGWLRPVLLVPASTLAGLSPRQLEAILAHELAHVRRHDYLVNLLQTAVETLLFYHPAVWWVSNRMRHERENCCDDLAVAVCGDRLGYARALADLEGLRSAGPRRAIAAMAADGGSLADRIRRLVGVPPRRSPRRSWVAGLLALALLPAGAAIQLACSHGSTSKQESQATSTADLAGTWSGELQGDQLRLEVKMHARMGRWAVMDTYPLSQLAGFTAGPKARFELRRDAGTFHFQGSFKDSRGNGTAAFSPNPEFARLIDVSPDNTGILELAAHDVSLGYAREMKELGYVRSLRQSHNLHLAFVGYVHDMIGRRPPAVDRLVALRAHGVTPDYVRGMKAAGYDLGAWELIDLHDHDVTPEWLRGIVKAYPGASPEDLIAMRVQGVDGAFIREAQSRSSRPLTVPQILSLHARGVSS